MPPKAPVPNLKSPSPKPKAPTNPKRCFDINTSLCMLALTCSLSPLRPQSQTQSRQVPNLKPQQTLNAVLISIHHFVWSSCLDLTPNLACANHEGKVGACASDVAESRACVSDAIVACVSESLACKTVRC